MGDYEVVRIEIPRAEEPSGCMGLHRVGRYWPFKNRRVEQEWSGQMKKKWHFSEYTFLESSDSHNYKMFHILNK